MWNKVKTFVVENRLISIFLALFVLLVASLGIYTNVVPEKDQATKSGSAEYKKAIKETTKEVEEAVGLTIPTKEELNDFLALEEESNGEFTSEEAKIFAIQDKYGVEVAYIVAEKLIPEAGMNSSQKAFILSDIKRALDKQETNSSDKEYTDYLNIDSMYNIQSNLDTGLTMSSWLVGFTSGNKESELVYDFGYFYENAEKLYSMETPVFTELEKMKLGYFFITENTYNDKLYTELNFFITPTKDLTFNEFEELTKDISIGINGVYGSLDSESGFFGITMTDTLVNGDQKLIKNGLIQATLLLDPNILTGEDTLMIQDTSFELEKIDINYRVAIQDK